MFTLKRLVAKAAVPLVLVIPAGNRQLIFWSLFLWQKDMLYLYVIGLATLNVIKNLLITPYFSVMVFGPMNAEIEKLIVILASISFSVYLMINSDLFHFYLLLVLFGEILLQFTTNRYIIGAGLELPIKRIIYLSIPYILLLLLFSTASVLLVFAIVLCLQFFILLFQFRGETKRDLNRLDLGKLKKQDFIWYSTASSLGLLVSSVWRLYYKDSPEILVKTVTILNVILVMEHLIGILKNILIRNDKKKFSNSNYQNGFFIIAIVVIVLTALLAKSEVHLIIGLLLFAKACDLGRGWLKTRFLSREMPKSYFAGGSIYFILSILSLEFFANMLSVSQMVALTSALGSLVYIIIFYFGNRRYT